MRKWPIAALILLGSADAQCDAPFGVDANGAFVGYYVSEAQWFPIASNFNGRGYPTSEFVSPTGYRFWMWMDLGRFAPRSQGNANNLNPRSTIVIYFTGPGCTGRAFVDIVNGTGYVHPIGNPLDPGDPTPLGYVPARPQIDPFNGLVLSQYFENQCTPIPAVPIPQGPVYEVLPNDPVTTGVPGGNRPPPITLSAINPFAGGFANGFESA